MNRNMNLIFEPMDLQAASPATVSRCGMVYMEPASMGWRVLLDSWLNTLPEHFTVEIKELISSLVDWVADHLLIFIRAHIEEASPTQDQNLLQSLFKIFKSTMTSDLSIQETFDTFSDIKNLHSVLEGKFVFSLIWSFGATANTLNKKKI